MMALLNGKVIRQERLPNGLVLLGEMSPASSSSALGFFVKTGSRDELPEEAGISHFLEHMMFKGTAKRDAVRLNYDLGNIGAQVNAFTSEECTVYYGSVIPEYFGTFHEILNDMLRPALDPVEFEIEKKVILEEIALYQDRPYFWLCEQSMLDYFAGHPAGNSVLGTTSSISALKSADMRAYYARRYLPSNMVCVATGNFDWEHFVARAREGCADWPVGEVRRKAEPFGGRQTRRVFKRKHIKQAHLLFVCSAASAQAEDRYALQVLAAMLGDSSGSKLYWRLVDTGLAETAGCESDERDNLGLFSAYASTDPQRMDVVAQIMQEVLQQPLVFSDSELEQAKAKLAVRLVLGGELPMGRLLSIGTAWLYRGELHNLRKAVRDLQTVSRADIQAAVEKYGLDKWGQYYLLPEDGEDEK